MLLNRSFCNLVFYLFCDSEVRDSDTKDGDTKNGASEGGDGDTKDCDSGVFRRIGYVV